MGYKKKFTISNFKTCKSDFFLNINKPLIYKFLIIKMHEYFGYEI